MGKTRSSGNSPKSIVTRLGDHGETSLLFGKRIPKNHAQVEACGDLDELNAALGMAKATLDHPPWREELEWVQKKLISLMGELAAAAEDHARYMESGFAKIIETDLQRLEACVKRLETENLSPGGWATPGINARAASLDFARTVARRAERRLVGLAREGFPLRPLLLSFTNRLSDLLWLLARQAESNHSPDS